jgi:DNA-directed RNA polymerase specialized sigma24 family protein
MAEKLRQTRTRKARKTKRQSDEGTKENEQTFAEWLCDREPKAPQRELTDVEVKALDDGYKACLKQACSVAARITGCTRKEAQDIVHGAVARMIRAAVTGRVAFPESGEPFRRRLMGYVRSVAKQVVAGPRPRPPIRMPGARCVKYNRRLMIWKEQEQLVSRRMVPERGLPTDMESYEESLDGPVLEEIRGVPWAAPRRTTARHGPCWPRLDRVLMAWDLSCILDIASYQLSAMQRKIIERVRDGWWGVEIARELKISPKTVDTHAGRAMETLRDTITRVVWIVPDGEDSPYKRHWSEWNPIIKRLEALRLERLAAGTDGWAA